MKFKTVPTEEVFMDETKKKDCNFKMFINQKKQSIIIKNKVLKNDATHENNSITFKIK